MPRNPKYPLEALREHRDRQVGAATAELGVAVRAREAADAAQRQLEEERVDAEARAESVRQEEATRLASGELRAADVARAHAWEHAVASEAAENARALERAEAHVSAAADVETQARVALAQRKAGRDVVAKDEARFEAGVRHAREAAEQEAGEEAFAARRRDV
jgi:hypothetical protein